MVAERKNPHQQQVFDHWDLLNQLAKKRFLKHGNPETSNLAEESVLYVLNKLEENDWFRVRQYREQSSFRAFLAQTTQRLLEDFARQKFGRSRIPDWIKKLGPLWARVYQKLCWERLPALEVVKDIRANFTKDSDPMAPEEIVAAIRGQIINCGALGASNIEHPFSDLPESFDPNTAADPSGQTPEKRVITEQRVRLLKIIAQWMYRQPEAGSEAAPDNSPLATTLQKLCDALPLTPEERLLLRLVFQEGLPVTAAGSRLGLNASQTHGRLRRLLERIRLAWQAMGLDQTFKGLLDGEDIEF